MSTNNNIVNMDMSTLIKNAKKIPNNESIKQYKTICLMLEKLCTEREITNEFIDSITFEDINIAQELISRAECEEDCIIQEMQKNTFFITLINKVKCKKTTNMEDFF